MRKLNFLLLFVLFTGIFSFFTSCRKAVEPINKYQHKKFVVVGISDDTSYSNQTWVTLKSPDSIFYITILDFDANELKIGDTL